MDLSVLDSFDELDRRVSFMSGTYSAKEEYLGAVSKDVADLALEEQILTNVQKTIAHLMDNLVKKDMNKMDKLINYGLDLVFPDRDISFKSDLKDTGKKFYIDLNTIDNGKQLTGESYGSVSVLQSYLLRMLCILKLKKAKLLLMDETFAAVGNDYINNVGSLIGELAEKLGIDVLLVTHNPGAASATMFNANLTKKDGLVLTKSKEQE